MNLSKDQNYFLLFAVGIVVCDDGGGSASGGGDPASTRYSERSP